MTLLHSFKELRNGLKQGMGEKIEQVKGDLANAIKALSVEEVVKEARPLEGNGYQGGRDILEKCEVEIEELKSVELELKPHEYMERHRCTRISRSRHMGRNLKTTTKKRRGRRLRRKNLLASFLKR